MTSKLVATLVLIVVAALALAACDDGSSSGKPTSVAGGATAVPGRSGIASELTTAVAVGAARPGPDGQYTIEITALGVAAPGIGAWTFNVTYDTSVLSIVDCPSEGTLVCNPEFEADALRFAGASAEGLLGDVVLGAITFRCESAGTSAIAVDLELLADATLGDPRAIDSPAVTDGEIVCE